MTTLAAEPNIFPPNLLDGYIELIDAVERAVSAKGEDEPFGREWWVLRTKARQEKAIARELSKRQTPFYLPVAAQRRVRRGQPSQAHLPLFAGYVFLYASPEERVASLKTNRVAQVLPVFDGQSLLRDLSQIERLVASARDLSVEPLLGPGKRVRVVSGGLEGVEGVIISRRGANRLFVSVDLIGQGVSLEVDDFMVEALD